MSHYTIAPAARCDLHAILDYFLDVAGNAELANRFTTCAEVTFSKLSKFPGQGRPRQFRRNLLKGLRSWRIDAFPTYLVFYRETEACIEIVRVLHGARDLEHLFAVNP
jgi:toxin ParE1/3/4